MHKLVNTDLEPEQLELANWLIENVSEWRRYDGNKLFAFIYPSDLQELGELLEAMNSDFFTDGTWKLEYNGTDLVFDAAGILEYTCGIDDFSLVYPEWSKDNDSHS